MAVACPLQTPMPPPPDDINYRILKLLEDNPNLTQRELARELDMSLGKANYCLKALITKGLVKVDNFKQQGSKAGYAYVLTPLGLAQKVVITKRFLARKLDEYETLKSDIARLTKEVTLADQRNKDRLKK